MNQELMNMAEEVINSIPDQVDFDIPNLFIEMFAALVAAAEREACAKVCEDTHQEYEGYTGQPKAFNYTCAAAIRNRGETK